jgi:hypothetical protein
MLYDGDGFLFRKTGVGKDGSASFGKFLAAIAASEQANVFVFAVPDANKDICCASNTVLTACFSPTKEVLQVVHDIKKKLQVPKK